MSAANLDTLLHLVLPLLVKGDAAKIESIIGVVEFICLAIEKIAKEYASKNKTVTSTDKVTLAFQAGGQVVDFLHSNKIISDSLAFDAKAVIGIESVLSGMISDIIKIWNKNRQIQAAAAEIQSSCCGCLPWSRRSEKSVHSASSSVSSSNVKGVKSNKSKATPVARGGHLGKPPVTLKADVASP